MTMSRVPARPSLDDRSPLRALSAFTAEDYRNRLERTGDDAAAGGFYGVLATPGPDLKYLTGYSPAAPSAHLTLLVVSAGQVPILVVPRRDENKAAAAPSAGLLSILPWDEDDEPYHWLAEILDPQGIYAVSDSAWAMHVLGLERVVPATRFRPLSEAFPLHRAIKEEQEVRHLAAAAAAVDAVYDRVVQARFAGRTEADLAAELGAELIAHGHSEVDFTVVASGPSGADSHHRAGNRVVQFGDAVVLEFGGRLGGYTSRISRTVSVGPPDARIQQLHDVVRRAQQAAFETLRPGVPYSEIDRASRRVLADAGFGAYIRRSAGHGIGMTVNEPPLLADGDSRALQSGMCCVVGAAIHLSSRFGVRIGDVVTVTANGARRLGRTGQELGVVY